MLGHWLTHAFSTYLLHPLNGRGYVWWSGPGSDVGEVVVIGAVIGAFRKVNCQAPRCWRIGHHRTADQLHHLCRRHHPDLPSYRLSLHEIHRRHHEAQRAGQG